MKKKTIRFTTIFALTIVSAAILMALFPSLFTQYDPLELDMSNKLQGPSAAHWLGTDEYGRDLWSRIVFGARISISVGFGAAALAMLLGVPLGLLAGFVGKTTDSIIMRIMDAFMSFPSVLLAILLITIFEPSALTLIFTISIVSFPAYGRIVRSSVLSLKEREFVEAARAFGAKRGYLLFRTILPNCASAIIVQFSLFAASSILIEASMSFLGLGIQPPAPAWGSMLSYAKTYINQSVTYILVPSAAIFLVVLAINLLGDALREWLDPMKLK
ncbi:MAG: ABC transporter permease [Clostridiaceae bacterium]|jgi:peptide/nickel transport system permease protein|nr:ABC transporter permease [Clostridiaceae bacterium]